MKTISMLPIFVIFFCACSGSEVEMEFADESAKDLGDIAREYLALELAMGTLDGAHVDAYFGPEAIQTVAVESKTSFADVNVRAHLLLKKLDEWSPATNDEIIRVEGLLSRLQSLLMRVQINQGDTVDFDDESQALFMTTAPHYDAGHFDAILDEVDALLPGDGPIAVRLDAFNQQFAIPPKQLAAVFEAAIEECRRRTLEHIELPENESFTIEYVTDKPWSGYNWYQGNAVSLIQINTDLPIFISRAVDLGCHEGYPGHHTYNALLEQNLVTDKGWLEYSLYPLFSAQSVVAEGSGNYGINLAFPGAERQSFEKSVLFPLAGLDVREADRYYELQALTAQLSFASNEAARGYLNGDLSREQAIDWLMKYSLSSRERAEQSTRFFDAYRSYVINYNHGKRLVTEFVERENADLATRWQRFETILSSPVLPPDLTE